MADEKKKAEGAKSAKKPNRFVQAGTKGARFFRECKAEINKIVWPQPRFVFKNTGVVLATVVVIGLFIFGLDSLFMLLLSQFMSLG